VEDEDGERWGRGAVCGEEGGSGGFEAGCARSQISKEGKERGKDGGAVDAMKAGERERETEWGV
jgi:hypothetical protein